MKHFKTGTHRSFFKVLHATRSAQAAMMVLQPGQATGEEPENEHPWAEQWLFVISGVGRAKVGKSRVSLRENSLLLIEKGEPHQVVSIGRRPLVTLNFYAPPAYTMDGELLKK
jgi:mannose-6-phosphate isomerase-like protein (cupin superfamily)